ncbi:MAG: glycosyltransferase [Planctomycetota bacterium]
MSKLVSFDGSCLIQKRPTGVERSFLLTLEAFARSRGAPRCLVFQPQASGIPLPEGVERHPIGRVPLFLWRKLTLPRLLEELRPVVHMSPTTALPEAAPCPLIATVHELPAMHAGAEENAVYGLRQDRAREALSERAWRVLVPSRHTARDLAYRHPELAQRTRVVPQPLDPEFLASRNRAKGPRRGLVFIGVKRRRKNLDRLLRSYATLPAALRRSQPLYWVGGAPEDGPGRLPGGLERIGALPTRGLAALLALARGLVLPSLSEGFGLPALEALALGIPVLGSRGSVTEELCGDLATLADPYDIGQIAAGLRRLIGDEDLQQRARRSGPLLARRFTAEVSARGWQRVLSEPSQGS